jgi:hypothetical protein
MTRLTARKTKLTFESADLVREQGRFREVVVEARPEYAILRLKGLRTGYSVPWSAIWSMAVKAQLARDRAEKKAGKR